MLEQMIAEAIEQGIGAVQARRIIAEASKKQLIAAGLAGAAAAGAPLGYALKKTREALAATRGKLTNTEKELQDYKSLPGAEWAVKALRRSRVNWEAMKDQVAGGLKKWNKNAEELHGKIKPEDFENMET